MTRRKNLLKNGWKYGNMNKQPRCKLCGRWMHISKSRKSRKNSGCGLLICFKCRKENKESIPIINKEKV